MLSKRPLTDRGIASLKPAKGAAYHLSWDALVPGLAVRVTATGSKSFVLVGRFPGSSNPTARALGKVGAITLSDARDKARAWHKLLATGVDPAQAREGHETVRAVCEDYQAREGSTLRSASWRRGALERLVYPTFGGRPIMELRRADMVRLHDKLSAENGPVIANRVVELLRRIFNWYSIRNEDFHSPIVRGMTTAEASRDRVRRGVEGNLADQCRSHLLRLHPFLAPNRGTADRSIGDEMVGSCGWHLDPTCGPKQDWR